MTKENNESTTSNIESTNSNIESTTSTSESTSVPSEPTTPPRKRTWAEIVSNQSGELTSTPNNQPTHAENINPNPKRRRQQPTYYIYGRRLNFDSQASLA